MWLPTVSEVIEQVATPVPKAWALQVPMVVAPSLNATLPVGVPPADVTVAVNTTGAPKVVLATLEVSTVVEAAAVTLCARAVELLEEKDVVPGVYSAVMERLPAARPLVVQVTAPALSESALQPAIAVPLSLNVTVPVGVPPADATVAVKLNASP